MERPIIEVRDVCKTFGKLRAVDRVSFNVPHGSCVGLLGPNGAGKTTMLKMLIGRAMRDSHPESQIAVFGCDPKRDELTIKYQSGVVPQDENLDSELTVLQNLRLYAQFYDLPRHEAMERIERLLNFMELGDKQGSRIRELSGGMKRRLLIARALLNAPRLLILDEPTTGLDPQVRHHIWDRIRLLRKEGVTVLITTHYMEEAFQLCERVIIMNAGRVIMEGNPAALIHERMERYVLQIRKQGGEEVAKVPGRVVGVRREETDDALYLYSDDLVKLSDISNELSVGVSHIRPANLEDLFLRVTGRVLHAAQ